MKNAESLTGNAGKTLASTEDSWRIAEAEREGDVWVACEVGVRRRAVSRGHGKGRVARIG